ncbi:uncharacterized protein LOC116163124 [Photinus pyralis]|uniref:uncharacterized protein LOC116163124 n=1 Tax=Photinus pyralis TaxID=7054 RepID=UPI00126704C0|nr:uncharacterized protein LOC116163124 [Photinus pyralis]
MTKSTMQVYYQNVRGIRTKMQNLMQSVFATNYDVICLTETWLNQDISSSELQISSNYNVYRQDRNILTSNLKRGGGVLIAVNKTLMSKLISTTVDNVEHIFVLVMFLGKCYIIGNVYIPPNSHSDVYDLHCTATENVLNRYPDHVLILCGDYNLPNIKWINDQYGLHATGQLNESGTIVADHFAYLNLYQVNNVRNDYNVILDLVFTNDFSLVTHTAEDFLLPIDHYHPPISLIVESCQLGADELKADYFYYDFKNCDFANLNLHLSLVNWDLLFSSCDMNVCVQSFYELLHHFFELYVPRRKSATSKFPKWFSRNVKELLVQKKVAHKKYKQTRL